MTTIFSRRRGRRRFIENYAFAEGLTDKLVEELGDRRAAEVALQGLRGWYLACLYADGELIGMPSRAVDVAWHEMILRTREYTYFCSRAFGAYLHHPPDSTLDVPMSMILPSTLEIVEKHSLPMTLFTADAETGVDDGYECNEHDLHSMRDAYEERAAAPRRQRRRYSSSAGWVAGTGGCGGFGDGGGGDHRGGGGGGRGP